MKNYVKVPEYQFKLLRPGDYIRWNKIYEEGITKGAAIIQIGANGGRKNWRLRAGNREFSMYWDNIEYVYLRKHPYFNILEEKINILSSMVTFMAKELGIEPEFIEFNKKINVAVNNLKPI